MSVRVQASVVVTVALEACPFCCSLPVSAKREQPLEVMHLSGHCLTALCLEAHYSSGEVLSPLGN